jgi:hypothetical protein
VTRRRKYVNPAVVRAEQKAIYDYEAHVGKEYMAKCLTDAEGNDCGEGLVKVMSTPKAVLLSWNTDKTELIPTWRIKPLKDTMANATEEYRPPLERKDFEPEDDE